MDKDLYQIMQKIYEKENQNAIEYKKFEVQDVQYMGTIETIEKINNVDTKIVKDIFKVIEKMQDGSIVENYYDDEITCIAGRNQEGQMYPSQSQIAKDINISEKIENLENNPTISLNEMNNEIEQIAKELGVKKEQILALSQYNLDQKIEDKENKEEKNEKIKLDDDEEQKDEEQKDEEQKDEEQKDEEQKDEEQKEEEEEQNKEEKIKQNEKALNNINSKQEIDLDKKVDDVHTLGQILGVKPGSKLIAVYSNSIANNQNTTRFSFIIKNQDGTLENADMLNQAGGKDSNKNIYEVNRDGSKVEEKSVQSSYAINSPITRNGLLTARVGDAGYIEISYGEMDRTKHQDALTHELKTDRTKDTTAEVREEFSYKKGTENIKEDIEELKEHEKSAHEDATLENADGDPTTGHKHLENQEHSAYEPAEVVEKIKQYEGENSENINEFSDKEIEDRLIQMSKKYPNENLDQLIERTQEDIAAEHIHISER